MAVGIKIPDFDDMLSLAELIGKLTSRKILLDVEIKIGEADVAKTANTNEKYFVNGKPPSMTFVDSTYGYTGFDGELIPKRRELADVVAELETAKLRFDVFRMQIDVYRTEAANQRATTLS